MTEERFTVELFAETQNTKANFLLDHTLPRSLGQRSSKWIPGSNGRVECPLLRNTGMDRPVSHVLYSWKGWAYRSTVSEFMLWFQGVGALSWRLIYEHRSVKNKPKPSLELVTWEGCDLYGWKHVLLKVITELLFGVSSAELSQCLKGRGNVGIGTAVSTQPSQEGGKGRPEGSHLSPGVSTIALPTWFCFHWEWITGANWSQL